jgi:uncharacterized protein YjiS (DUF1127 family)
VASQPGPERPRKRRLPSKSETTLVCLRSHFFRLKYFTQTLEIGRARHEETLRDLPPLRRQPSQAKLARIQLAELSDWSLRDIGVLRQTSRLDAVKPFWMA